MSNSALESRPATAPERPVPSRDDRKARVDAALNLLERYGLLVLFVLTILFFSWMRPETFATAANFRTIVTAQSVVAVCALALTFPLMAGRFDISVGATLGVSAIATAAVMSKHGLPLLPAVVFGIAFGAFIGVVNGSLVAYFGVNAIIGTLGTSTVLSGLITAYTQGVPITTSLSTTLTDLGSDRVAGIPAIFLIMLALSVIVWYVLTQTPYGRQLAAVGVNQRAAVLTGMRVRRIILLSFVASGLLGGAAGVMQVASQGTADPTTGGLNFILPAIAAVFLGATTWHPGRFNIPGTVLSLFFLGTAVSGLALIGAEPWVNDLFNGLAIVIAIALSSQFRRRRTGEMNIGT
ncbi:MAG TPA: ABC transporter permease [Solirubrobacterales bacterium]|nr:ABC transporter permease [Solirubrobacterales bacterium]